MPAPVASLIHSGLLYDRDWQLCLCWLVGWSRHAKQHFPAVIFPGRRYWPSESIYNETRCALAGGVAGGEPAWACQTAYSMLMFLGANLGRFRVFSYSHMKDTSYTREYQMVPYGLAWEVVTKDFDPISWLDHANDTIPHPPQVLQLVREHGNRCFFFGYIVMVGGNRCFFSGYILMSTAIGAEHIPAI